MCVLHHVFFLAKQNIQLDLVVLRFRCSVYYLITVERSCECVCVYVLQWLLGQNDLSHTQLALVLCAWYFDVVVFFSVFFFFAPSIELEYIIAFKFIEHEEKKKNNICTMPITPVWPSEMSVQYLFCYLLELLHFAFSMHICNAQS